MKKSVFLDVLIILLVLAAACQRLGSEKIPGVDLPLEEMNDGLSLSAPPELSSFQMGDNLRLVLVNSSDQLIILPQDFGVLIFQEVEGKWETIENWIEYPTGEKNVYPGEDQPFREVIVVVHPVVFSEEPVTVRIVVVGNYYDEISDTKGKQVGAFIDITLKLK